jgi:hypothetical protein
MANLTADDIASYQNAFGEAADVTSEEGKAKVYAYREYTKDLKRMDEAATSEDIISQMTSMGYEMNETTIKQVTDMVQGLDDAGQASFLQQMQDGGGGEISPETGTGSIYFFDWAGNPISAGSPPQNDADKLYDAAWIDYHKMAPDTTITRDEFKQLMVAKGATYLSGKTTNDSTGIAVDLMIANGKGPELKAFMDSEEGTKWWTANRLETSPPGTHTGGGNNWDSGQQIKQSFKDAGYVDGAMIDIGAGHYMVSGDAPVRTNFIDSWDDSWTSDIYVIDLATGEALWMPIGKHDQ